MPPALSVQDDHETQLARLAQQLGTARQLTDILRALRAHIEAVTGNNAMFVSLLEAPEQLRRCVYAWSDGAEVDVSELPLLPLSGNTPHAQAIATGQVVVATDLQSTMAALPNVRLGYDRDPRAPSVSVAVPLAVLGRVIGGFEVQMFEHADPWSTVPSLQVAANLAAAAIENVRLIENERELRLAAEASEERYRTSEQRLRLALQAAGLGTWEFDLATNGFTWSAGTERLFGWPAGPQLRSWAELLEIVEPDDRALVDDMLGPSIRDTPSDVEFRVAQPDGTSRWLAGRASVAVDVDGTPARVLAVVIDITVRKEAEQQHEVLARSQQLRALGQMASGIAHDLNQKLALISGYSELASDALAAPLPDVDALSRLLDVTSRAAQDGARTLQQLLAFARAHRPDALQPLDLAELLREVAEMTGPRWRGAADAGRPVRLDLDLPADGALLIEGSSGALREAFTNLVFNAVDALAEGGTIGLRARRVGSRIVAEVSDTGPGIPPELQARIFEPFFTTKGEQGTGLGLAQVAGVVARHGGELLLESAPGKGTTFRMLFPVTKAVAQSVVPEEPISRPAHRPRRVLAVEDDPKLRNMIELMLRPHGHDVRLAESAEAALQVLEIEPPFDVVISDVSMGPGMTGWELAERIRERWPSLPVVLASGWGAQIDQDQAAARGIAAVLAKPYRMSELRDLVAGLELPGPSADGC